MDDNKYMKNQKLKVAYYCQSYAENPNLEFADTYEEAEYQKILEDEKLANLI